MDCFSVIALEIFSHLFLDRKSVSDTSVLSWIVFQLLHSQYFPIFFLTENLYPRISRNLKLTSLSTPPDVLNSELCLFKQKFVQVEHLVHSYVYALRAIVHRQLQLTCSLFLAPQRHKKLSRNFSKCLKPVSHYNVTASFKTQSSQTVADLRFSFGARLESRLFHDCALDT
jgi:hypothetical protein